MTPTPQRSGRRRGAAIATTALLLAPFLTLTAPTAAGAAPAGTTITPQPAYAGEPFQGWGTSLVWFANATGGYPDDVRNDLVEKTFGEDGLRLNIARYNVGGGNAVDVPDYLRPGGAVEGWWNPDGIEGENGHVPANYDNRWNYRDAFDPTNDAHYNFDADKTQRWWIDAIKDRVDTWESFSNSPPYFLVESGFTSGGVNDGNSEQLKPHNVDDFTGYMTRVTEYIEEAHGIEFDTIDPFNEPNTNYWSTTLGWDGWPTSKSRQEGAHIGPWMQDQVIRSLDRELAKDGRTTNAKISAMDETNPHRFWENWNGWSTESQNIVEQLNVHTYSGGGRIGVRDIAKVTDKKLWMSEVEGDWDGTGYNLTNIDNGLGMANHVIEDLRLLEPDAWVLWQPVEDTYNMEKEENLNWGSIFVDFDCDANGNSKRRLADGDADPSCKVETNAKYNTLRNFTHYIRPGDRLIGSGNNDATAALRADGTGTNIVYANNGDAPVRVTVDLKNFSDIARGASVTPVTTTESPASDPTRNGLVRGDAVAIDAAARTATLTVPAKSVTTFVVDGVSTDEDGQSVLQDGGVYEIEGVQSGRDLTAFENRARINAAVPGAKNQKWTVRILEDDASSQRQTFALLAEDGRALVDSWGWTGLEQLSDEQLATTRKAQWVLSSFDGQEFSFLNRESTRMLDVDGEKTAENTEVAVWTSGFGANQRWTIRNTAATGTEPVTVSTLPGTPAELPDTVVPTYRYGSDKPLAVTWNTDGTDWTTVGVRTVTGTATDRFGNDITATATVSVGDIDRTIPRSLTSYVGVTKDEIVAAAPTTVDAQMGSGSERVSVPVSWDFDALTNNALTSPGIIRVTGTATAPLAGATPVDALLSVIITEAELRNIAPDSDAFASSQEGGYSPARTINRVLDDKGWSNWKGSGQNASDSLRYELAAPAALDRVTMHFYQDGATESWPASVQFEVREAGSSAWTPVGDPVTPAAAQARATGGPQASVDLGGIRADAVRAVLTAKSNTHMVVSETEIFARSAGTSSETGLAAITVDGAAVEIPATGDEVRVAVPGAALPVVEAHPVDTNAEVVVTPASETDPVARITITAADGTKREFSVRLDRTATISDARIEGHPAPGETLTAEATVEPSGATLSYQWTRNGGDIAGATNASYTVTAADASTELRVTLTAAREGYLPSTVQTEPVTVAGGNGSEGAANAGSDADSDAGSDADSEAGSDADSDAGSEAGSDADSDAGANGNAQITVQGTSTSNADATADADAEGTAGSDADSEGTAGSEADAEGTAGSEADAEGTAGSEADAEGTAGSEADAEGTAGSEADAEGTAGSEADAEGTAGSEADAEGTAGSEADAEGAAGSDSDAEGTSGSEADAEGTAGSEADAEGAAGSEGNASAGSQAAAQAAAQGTADSDGATTGGTATAGSSGSASSGGSGSAGGSSSGGQSGADSNGSGGLAQTGAEGLIPALIIALLGVGLGSVLLRRRRTV